MKAVKINMTEAKTSKSVKAIILGVLLSFGVIFLVTIVLALFLNVAGSLFEEIAGYLLLLPLSIGGYIGGYTSARIKGSNGMITGLICSLAVFIILLILGLSIFNTNITYMILLKGIALILPALIGGVKGVNKKEKFKI